MDFPSPNVFLNSKGPLKDRRLQHCEGRIQKDPESSQQAGPCKIAFIVSAFPMLYETFILNEIIAMEQLNLDIEIYPLLRKRDPVDYPQIDRLIKRTHYQPFLSGPVLYASWYFIRRYPLEYFRVLFEVLKGTFGSFNFFFGTLGIFWKSVRFAYEMANDGIKHIHAQFANHPAIAALIIKRPFSLTARGSDIHKDRRMLDRKIAAAEFAITVSDYNKKLMVKACGQRFDDKIHVIYGGIDTDAVSPSSRRHPNRSFQILCIARFEEVKGHHYLVEACRLLQQRGVDFECHLIGDGPLYHKIEQQVAKAGLSHRIRFHGNCPHAQVIERLSLADVAVLATVTAGSGKREGIPNVLKEAMACGLPVVGSIISGIPELVEDGISGFLVPPGDATALANALQKLHENSALRQRMGRAGREKIVHDFNLRKSTYKRACLFLKRNLGTGGNEAR
jgi:glycosyltransferase involved in cell wall biosynthesis